LQYSAFATIIRYTLPTTLRWNI